MLVIEVECACCKFTGNNNGKEPTKIGKSYDAQTVSYSCS